MPMVEKLKAFRNSPSFRRNVFTIITILLATACFIYYYGGYETTDNAFIEGNVVPISSKVPGYVSSIKAEDNQKVLKGDIILEIDPTDFEIAVQKAEAALEAIGAQYHSAEKNFETALISIPSTYDSARAQYDSALANVEKAQADLNRLKGQNNLTRTQKDLDYAIAAYKTAVSQLDDANAKLKSANTVDNAISAQRSTVEQLKAQMKLAKAELKQAKDDLENTKVRAPYDGQIVKKTVEVGAYIQPGQTLLSLVGKEFWVIANFKETQLRKIKTGAEVSISIDAFPKLKLKGQVESMQSGTGSRLSLFPAENATGNYVKVVQRIPVKITLDPNEYKNISLAVGMSVVPKVKVR